MRFETGAVFAGYSVVKRLGRGGMASVYLVRESGINRLVALKVLPEQLVDDSHFAARFEQEAQVVGGLDHPNIVPLYRYGITDDVPWMALRYVDGGDFGARLADHPLSVPEGLSILRGVASALDYAHRRGVIHRDLKPQNILLTGDGAAYLADFGVAKLLEGTVRLKTATGNIMGTPAYMSPEQAKGEQLGPHTDVYALAVICFQWLTGSLPFNADTPYAILIKHVQEPVPPGPLALLAPNVATVLVRGLAKLPEERFQAASTLIAQLEHALYAPSTQPLPTAIAPSLREDSLTSSESASQVAEIRHKSRALWKAIAAVVTLWVVVTAGCYIYWLEVMKPAAEQRAVRQQAADQATAKQVMEAAAAKQTADAAAAKQPAEKSGAERRAANEAATNQPADRRAADEAAAKQAGKTQATLIVKVDAACQLTVNGEAKGALQANKAKTLKLNPGEQLIECTSSEDPAAKAQQTKPVAAGAQAVVVLSLAETIASKQREAQQQRAAAESAAKERAAAESAAIERAAAEISARGRAFGFVDLGNGVLIETLSRLLWAQSDNGSKINWNDAKSYCERKGSGWRLPSADELAAIYDSSEGLRGTPCMSYTCKVSPLFHLTGVWFWSGTLNGSEAWSVNLSSGRRQSFSVSSPVTLPALQSQWALCVRGS